MNQQLHPSNFHREINDRTTDLYCLKNKNSLEAYISNYGARIIALWVPDKNGKLADIVTGYPTIDTYMERAGRYHGATVGRFANRIAKGVFTLDGKTYQLETNNGPNHLHGGIGGFASVVWDAQQTNEQTLELTYQAADMEEGYPGNLVVKAVYELNDKNELQIKYEAICDQTTVINLTHHSFFNLSGDFSKTVEGHLLQINADSFTPTDSGMIPTGELARVRGSAFDFTEQKPIGEDIDADDAQLKQANGYDHNYVLNKNLKNEDDLHLAATATEPESGRNMQVWTTEPGMQFYSGNSLRGTPGKYGYHYGPRAAFCLETQHFPDSPNQAHFPSTTLEKGKTFKSITIYKFT